MKKRCQVLMLCVLMALLVLAVPVYSKEKSKSSLKLNRKELTLKVGQTFVLRVQGKEKKARYRYTSSNKKVATVSSKGVIKGVGGGSAIIKVRVGKKTLKCKVTVTDLKQNHNQNQNQNQNPSVVQNIDPGVFQNTNGPVLSVSTTDLTINHSGKLVVTFLKKKEYKVSFSVEDTNILKAKWADKWSDNQSIELYLTGKKNGSTNVTITNSYNDEKYVIKVTVVENEVGVTREFGEAIMQKGQLGSDGGYYLDTYTDAETVYKVVYYPDDNTYALLSDIKGTKCEIHYDPKNYKNATILCGPIENHIGTASVDPTVYKVDVQRNSATPWLTFHYTSYTNDVSLGIGDPYPVKKINQIALSVANILDYIQNCLYNFQIMVTTIGCEVYVFRQKMSTYSLKDLGWPNLY